MNTKVKPPVYLQTTDLNQPGKTSSTHRKR
jgi:hypothetical protein